MPHLEPTYLRYIYDGLIKGSIHPENAAELPDGLIGMYEEAFDERQPVQIRQQLLERFAIWALLKKEVSAAFVAEVLCDTEDEIQDFISNYSAWFNSPESGKYQIYHERLKVYLLQKLGEGEIHELHEKLISRLEKAIEEQQADEFEWYGLEFLAGHLGVSVILNGDAKKLIELAYSQTHWQRQLKICKGYSWTKNGLKEVMAWASKYNDDEVIECGLQMVDLHHQEQNAAPQIVALVTEGDIDSALKRIEQFGGNDKETQKKKIIIYFLCLWQIVNSTEQDTEDLKIKAEKILEHFNKTLAHEITPIVWELMFSRVLSTFHLLFKLNTIGVNYYDFLKQFKSNKDDQIFKWDILELDDLKDSNEIMKWSQLIDSLPCEISKCSLFAQLAVKSHKYQNKLSKELNKISGKLFKSITSLKLSEKDNNYLDRLVTQIAIYGAISSEVGKTLKFVRKFTKKHRDCDWILEKIAIYLTKTNHKDYTNYIESIDDEINYARAFFSCSIELIESDKQYARTFIEIGNNIISKYDEGDWSFELGKERVLATYKLNGLKKSLAEINNTYRGNSTLDSLLVVINQLIKENKIKKAKDLFQSNILDSSIKKGERVFLWSLSFQKYEQLALTALQLDLLDHVVELFPNQYKGYLHWAVINFKLITNPTNASYNIVFDNCQNDLTQKLETLMSVSIKKLNSEEIIDGRKIIEYTSDLVWKEHDGEIRNDLWLKLIFICRYFQLYNLKNKLKANKELENKLSFSDYFESPLKLDLKNFIVTDAIGNTVETNAANLTKSNLITHLKTFYNDEVQIKIYLSNWYVQKLFFGQASKSDFNRANRILNIQWAIDIKNKLHN